MMKVFKNVVKILIIMSLPCLLFSVSQGQEGYVGEYFLQPVGKVYMYESHNFVADRSDQNIQLKQFDHRMEFGPDKSEFSRMTRLIEHTRENGIDRIIMEFMNPPTSRFWQESAYVIRENQVMYIGPTHDLPQSVVQAENMGARTVLVWPGAGQEQLAVPSGNAPDRVRRVYPEGNLGSLPFQDMLVVESSLSMAPIKDRTLQTVKYYAKDIGLVKEIDYLIHANGRIEGSITFLSKIME